MMAEPWDRPPFPKKGNASQTTLFAAVGNALNAWEEIEIALAHLYAAFVTEDRFDRVATRAYGVPINFKNRFSALQTAATRYFAPRADQPGEGEFDRLSRLILGYSSRRNDIAHGHVWLLHWFTEPHPPRSIIEIDPNKRWCLVPAFFDAKKLTASNRPIYAFTSRELNEFADIFWDLARAVSNLAVWLIQDVEPPFHGIHPRPDALPYKVRAPRTRRE